MVWQTYPIVKITLALIILLWLFAFWQNRLLKKMQQSVPVTVKRSKARTGGYVIFILLLGSPHLRKAEPVSFALGDAFIFTDDFKANTALNPFQSFSAP
jgi:hypothetical protein